MLFFLFKVIDAVLRLMKEMKNPLSLGEGVCWVEWNEMEDKI